MHEELIREFVERAESEVEMPDLATLQARGHQRRRNRGIAAAVVIGAAVAAVGLGILAATSDSERSAPPPAEEPNHVTVQQPVPDKELAAGREYTVAAYGQDYAQTIDDGEQIVVRFRVEGSGWIWLRDAVGKWGPDADPAVWPQGSYGTVQFSLVDRFPVTDCTSGTPRWQAAAGTPLGAARQAATVPGVKVLAQPTTAAWAGWPAAHVRLMPTSLCGEPASRLMWSVFPQTTAGNAGVGTTILVGQRIDVWFVAVEDTLLVVAVDQTPGLPGPMRGEIEAIRDSIELELVQE